MAFGGLLLAAVLLDDLADRVKLPGILLVLALGLLVDNDLRSTSEPLLSLVRADRITQSALVLVLFFGGLTTNWTRMKSVIRPAARLASLGVLLTAGLLTLIGVGALMAQGTWQVGLLAQVLFVGAMLSSTDASAALSLLRPLAGRLPQRVLDLIEMESTINDPMAVVLANVALALAGGTGLATADLVTDVIRQFLLGGLLGFIGGSMISQLLMGSQSLTRGSMLPVVSLALLLVLSGGTTLMGGSPLLAAYVAGLVLGNSRAAAQEVLEEAHSSFAKMAELMLFLCLGLVVAPQNVVEAAGWALLLVLAMQLVRWLMVQLLLLRADFQSSEKRFVSWTGLRGAVPIAMAIQAWASPVAWGKLMPPLALAVVLFGLLLQGFALVPIAHRLGLVLPSEESEPT
ncbi:putative Na+/H+ antiporter, CPA1 family [Synechococcus sp. CC9902]|jgi:CPA1 family monovalent cation:H+ antiporter/cell volume regulation protein A|uniref:cation:proton antiporter domain-containing protein n=1 Tax=Synechococcus sp. (strain CC9902) TaxID=316279 RepID=UPI00005D3DDE|nr:putative Na+/H+ antiporter, CPA1 family [Synechococcus sp. CC9902]